MKRVEGLAADYWIENTDRIYAEDLHISTPVMYAYEAGFRAARDLILEILDEVGPGAADTMGVPRDLGEEPEPARRNKETDGVMEPE